MPGKALTIKLEGVDEDIRQTLERDVIARLERASVDSMEDFSKVVLRAGRGEIAKGGGKFTSSNRFRNALKAKVYENDSTDAAIFVYHKVPYSGIFETGGLITGRPFLWLPTDNLPAGVRTPKQFRRFYPNKKLRSVRGRKGKNPLLVADIGLGGLSSKSRSVPVFVGIPTVEIRQAFAVRKAIEGVLPRFEAIYSRNLRRFE